MAGPAHARIHFDRAKPQQRRDRLRGAARKRAQAGHELVEGEGFHQVVVRARVQGTDPVIHLVARRQHQHRQRAATAAEFGEHRESVEAGQHQVQHHRVVRVAIQVGQRHLPVRGHVAGMAVAAQVPAQGVRQDHRILDQQDAHARFRLLQCVLRSRCQPRWRMSR